MKGRLPRALTVENEAGNRPCALTYDAYDAYDAYDHGASSVAVKQYFFQVPLRL
ncbi:hypothetical protein ABZ929_23235 [Streptomyces physcomitrii]|uniref:hypothetical protein n=1 Tax=Streptomyces physcomitrii TaxID=2724184 RepID=UPI003428871E